MSPSADLAQNQNIFLPEIRIQSASPVSFEQHRPKSLQSPTRASGLATRSKTLPTKLGTAARKAPNQTRKRLATILSLEAEEKGDEMAPGKILRHGSDSSSKKQPSSPASRKSSTKASPKDKDNDWTDVTDPEERRRIQNRIAQRKFREKAKENKEKAERESRNQEHAGNSYRIPLVADVTNGQDQELSGLPWGSLNWSLVLTRGHEAESRRSSGRDTHVGDEPYAVSHYTMPYGADMHQTASHGSSGGDDIYYDDTNYYK